MEKSRITFKVGDRVVVKAGTPDPDFPEKDISGWAGIVYDIDTFDDGTLLVCFKLDDEIIDTISDEDKEQMLIDGWDYTEICVLADQLHLI